MSGLLPGTEVHARGLRWEVVFARQLGPQTLFRLRGLAGGAPAHGGANRRRRGAAKRLEPFKWIGIAERAQR